MSVLSDTLQICSVVLQVLLLFFLLSGAFRKYSVVLVFCVMRLASHAILFILYHQFGTQSRIYGRGYWTDEVLLDLMLFLVVISLTYKALEDRPQRAFFGKVLTGIVAGVVILPFLVFARPFSTHWFDRTSQLLNFGAAIMNLALWSALLGSKHRDSQLLAVSMGVCVTVTGAAISYGVRQWLPAHDIVWLPNTFMALTHIAGVFIWCWAFRPAVTRSVAPAQALKV